MHLAGVVPPDLVLVRVKLPDGHSAETPRLPDLPRDWDLVPAGPGSMDFGTKWAREQRSLVLYVPSAVLREETNTLLNPGHAEFAAVTMTIERAFSYDPRMYLPRRAPTGKRP